MEDDFDDLPAIIRGRPAVKMPAINSVRSATAEDRALLETTVSPSKSFITIRNPHHQLAQMLARGVSNNEASQVTGYSPSYISNLKNDPGFAELLSHYGAVTEVEGVDTIKRMRTVGLMALEIIQDRITQEPDDLSMRELMEIERLNLVEPMKVISSAAMNTNPNAGVKVQVNFVSPTATRKAVKDVEDISFEELKK